MSTRWLRGFNTPWYHDTIVFRWHVMKYGKCPIERGQAGTSIYVDYHAQMGCAFVVCTRGFDAYFPRLVLPFSKNDRWSRRRQFLKAVDYYERLIERAPAEVNPKFLSLIEARVTKKDIDNG